jgi:Ner family transcriptional regulator
MHEADILALVRESKWRFLPAIAKANSLSHSALKTCLRRPQLRAEKALSKALGVQPHVLWPDRWSANGERLVKRGRPFNEPSPSSASIFTPPPSPAPYQKSVFSHIHLLPDAVPAAPPLSLLHQHEQAFIRETARRDALTLSKAAALTLSAAEEARIAASWNAYRAAEPQSLPQQMWHRSLPQQVSLPPTSLYDEAGSAPSNPFWDHHVPPPSWRTKPRNQGLFARLRRFFDAFRRAA